MVDTFYEKTGDLMVRHSDYKSVAEALEHAQKRIEKLEAALDGTHYHHKKFEPLCTHCQESYVALGAEKV